MDWPIRQQWGVSGFHRSTSPGGAKDHSPRRKPWDGTATAHPSAPEGRKIIAHGASRGMKPRPHILQPRRGERTSATPWVRPVQNRRNTSRPIDRSLPPLRGFTKSRLHTHGLRRGLRSFAPPGLRCENGHCWSALGRTRPTCAEAVSRSIGLCVHSPRAPEHALSRGVAAKSNNAHKGLCYECSVAQAPRLRTHPTRPRQIRWWHGRLAHDFRPRNRAKVPHQTETPSPRRSGGTGRSP